MLVFKNHALGSGWNWVEPGRLRIEQCGLSRSWLLMAPPNSLNCEARRSQGKRGLNNAVKIQIRSGRGRLGVLTGSSLDHCAVVNGRRRS